MQANSKECLALVAAVTSGASSTQPDCITVRGLSQQSRPMLPSLSTVDSSNTAKLLYSNSKLFGPPKPGYSCEGFGLTVFKV